MCFVFACALVLLAGGVATITSHSWLSEAMERRNIC